MYFTLAETNEFKTMAQISASVSDNTIEVIKKIAEQNNHSFSKQVSLMLTDSAAKWILSKAKNKKK